MKNYEQMKNHLMELGFEEWQIYSPEQYQNIKRERDASELEVCGAFSVFRDYVHNEWGYEYQEIDETLCTCDKNEVGFVDWITMDDEAGFWGFYIMNGIVYVGICDSDYETQAYIRLINR